MGFVVGALFRHLGERLHRPRRAGGRRGRRLVGRHAARGCAGRSAQSGVVVGLVVLAGAVVRAVGSTDRIALRLAIVLVLLGVTMACARAAMERDLHGADPGSRPEGPPRRAVLLCNPRSGDGAVERFGLTELAAELGVETVMLGERAGPGDAGPGRRGTWCRLSRRGRRRRLASRGGCRRCRARPSVRVCECRHTQPLRDAISGSTATTPVSRWARFVTRASDSVDYATVNGRMFINNVSLGVYAAIVHDDSYRDAKLETTMNLLPELHRSPRRAVRLAVRHLRRQRGRRARSPWSSRTTPTRCTAQR